jgi:uncharacterized repeat protein (TIGR03843 family)
MDSMPEQSDTPDNDERQTESVQRIDLPRLLDLLVQGEITSHNDIPWSSNYTFLVEIERAPWRTLAVYKPQRGEAPLWDFRSGTLCYREYAAYLLSAALDWWLVPPTVLRSGPFGLGMVQMYVDADPNETYFTLRQEFRSELQRIAAFDAITNNADRKGGHVLRAQSNNRLWAIDHGLTFHTEYKLRTVVWDFAGQALPSAICHDLEELRSQLVKGQPLSDELGKLLSPGEIGALRRRIDGLLTRGTFPAENPNYRNYPWPAV